MSQVKNFTRFFEKERDIYVQNISNCQVSVQFDVGPGHSESHLFPNSKDPVNLTQKIPFHAIKASMDFRRMLNRVPPALHLLEDAEYDAFYERKAHANGLGSKEEAIQQAEEKLAAVQAHEPLPNSPKPMKVTDTHDNDPSVVSEQEVINPRILNLCLQVHSSLDDQEKMSAQNFLAELDAIQDLTLMDWEYVMSNSFYKSTKNLAKKKVAELATRSVADDEDEAPVKPKKTKASVQTE